MDSLSKEMSLTVSGDDVPSDLPGTVFMTDAVLEGKGVSQSRRRVTGTYLSLKIGQPSRARSFQR